MRKPEEIQALMAEAFSGRKSGFRPCAFFDDRLDCIRVIARDCSVLEDRINDRITVLVDMYHPRDGKEYVGFTLKGARHFCEQHELNLSTSLTVSSLLDAIAKTFPDALVGMFVNLVARPLVSEQNIDKIEIPELVNA